MHACVLASQHVTQGKRIVAIVDPPREGLHPKVIQALRRCKGLDELVYISCNHGKCMRMACKPVCVACCVEASTLTPLGVTIL